MIIEKIVSIVQKCISGLDQKTNKLKKKKTSFKALKIGEKIKSLWAQSV